MTAIRRAVALTATVFAMSIVGPSPALAGPRLPSADVGTSTAVSALQALPAFQLP